MYERLLMLRGWNIHMPRRIFMSESSHSGHRILFHFTALQQASQLVKMRHQSLRAYFCTTLSFRCLTVSWTYVQQSHTFSHPHPSTKQIHSHCQPPLSSFHPLCRVSIILASIYRESAKAWTQSTSGMRWKGRRRARAIGAGRLWIQRVVLCEWGLV